MIRAGGPAIDPTRESTAYIAIFSKFGSKSPEPHNAYPRVAKAATNPATVSSRAMPSGQWPSSFGHQHSVSSPTAKAMQSYSGVGSLFLAAVSRLRFGNIRRKFSRKAMFFGPIKPVTLYYSTIAISARGRRPLRISEPTISPAPPARPTSARSSPPWLVPRLAADRRARRRDGRRRSTRRRHASPRRSRGGSSWKCRSDSASN